MPQTTPEERAEYQRQYRQRKRQETFGKVIDEIFADKPRLTEKHPPPIVETVLPEYARVVPTAVVPRPTPRRKPPLPSGDRGGGLPRSNYYTDPYEPGGWIETIQNADPKVVTKILDRIATKTRNR